MSEEHALKLYELFRKKMADFFRKNAVVQGFGTCRIEKYNAWQSFLRDSLSLDVIDIEEGETPGVVRIRGRVAGIRILNPSNAARYGREFIVVPLELAERCLMLNWIPDEWPPKAGG